MTWKSYIAASAVGVVATYMASSPLLPQRTAPSAANPESGMTSALPDADIERQAERLASGLRAEASFRAPSRNPFRFSEPVVTAPKPPLAPTPLDAAAASSPAPEPPFIVLSGMATDIVDGVTVRTAVLTTASGVTFVREGEMVGAEYRVREIREDGVELESTSDGSLRALRFPEGAR